MSQIELVTGTLPDGRAYRLIGQMELSVAKDPTIKLEWEPWPDKWRSLTNVKQRRAAIDDLSCRFAQLSAVFFFERGIQSK